MLAGGCYCGRVRYEAEGPPFHETICHCADCRRAVGAASVAWFSVPRPSFRFVAGEPARFASSPGVERTFCPACGTALTYEGEGFPGEIDVTIASLDDAEAVSPKDHVQTAGRLDWDALCDGLPSFSGRRPGR